MTQINEIMKRVNTGDAVLIVMSDWNSFLHYGKLLCNVPITQKMFRGDATRCICVRFVRKIFQNILTYRTRML